MKRKTIKAKIAAALSASMAFAMLAPAMPAYAAGVNLKFDFGELQKKSLVAGNYVIDSGTQTAGAAIDPDYNLQPVAAPGTGTRLPFIDSAGNVNLTYNVHGKTWADLDLVGYTIDKWLDDSVNAREVDKLDIPTYQDITYYAKLKSDGTNAMKLNVTHVGAGTTPIYVPGVTTVTGVPAEVPSQNKVNEPHKVLETIQTMPLRIPGYKAATAEVTGPGQAAGVSGGIAADPASNYVSFQTTNKDVNIKYVYSKSNEKFSVKVYDRVWKNLSTTPGSGSTPYVNDGTQINSSKQRTAANVTDEVLHDLSAHNIKANSTMAKLQATDPEKRYILDPVNPVTITYAKGIPLREPTAAELASGAPLPGETQFNGATVNAGSDLVGYFKTQAGNALYTNIIPAKSIGSYVAISDMGDNEHTIQGMIPNQNVTITYNYYDNPNYTTKVEVKYFDEKGIDITDKVIAENPSIFTSDAGVTTPTIGTVYKDANDNVYIPVAAAQADYRVPVPVMDEYISDVGTSDKRPTIDTEDAGSWSSSYRFGTSGAATSQSNAYTAAQEGWGTGHEYYNITVDRNGDGAADTPVKDGKLVVTYTTDPNRVAGIIFSATTGGRIVVDQPTSHDWNPATYPTDAVTLARENIGPAPDRNYELTIDETAIPTPVPDTGYVFEGWKYNNNLISFTGGTAQITGIPGNRSNVSLKASFKEDPSSWLDVDLSRGNSNVQLLAGTRTKVLGIDSSGNQRTSIPFSELSGSTTVAGGGVSVDAGYTLEWRALKNTPDGQRLVVVNPTDNILDFVSLDFIAFGVSSTPVAPYTPVVDGLLDVNGVPTLQIDTRAPAALDTRLDYIVTDDNGNVVAIVPGTSLSAAGGNIQGNFLVPGNNYHVATADSTATGITVGSPLPTGVSGVSAQSNQVQIPAVLNATAIEDPSNPGRASITVNPTAPNTVYALVDPNGNIVYPYTAPTGGSVTFDNLDPNTIYTVVPNAITDSTSPAVRAANGAGANVDTGNLGLSVADYKVTILTHDAPMPTLFKVAGHIVTDLEHVGKGQRVEIVGQPIDNNGNLFGKWIILSQNTNTPNNEDSNIRLSFIMPEGPVVIQQAFAGSNIPDWSIVNDSVAPYNSQNVAPTIPVINESGNFRIYIHKQGVSNARENLVKDALSDNGYKGLFELTVKVQKQVGTDWVDYVDPTGNAIDLDTKIETGVLLRTRHYHLHEATASNATPVSTNDGMDLDDHASDPNYNGWFGATLTSGSTYIFGYVASGNRVDFISTITGNRVITVEVQSGKELNTADSQYGSVIPAVGTKVEDRNTGLTWTYVGLRKNANGNGIIDESDIVDSDMRVYLYYTNDQSHRNKLVRDLNGSITKADALDTSKYKASDVAELQAKVAEARALLNSTAPSMALSPELETVLEELNAILKRMGVRVPNSGGGGRGRGGSGGGSGSASRRSSGYTAGLRVGHDGNWELTNPVEATANPDSSKWVFNLANGGRAKGWAYLSYTYEGKTKSEWYHFAEDGIMDSGWFLDGSTWYYLSMNHNGFYGEMIKGWHHDGQDGRWYYLDSSSGAMHTNWSKINGEFYFLNPTAPAQTWFFDNATGRWNFGNINSRPYGSMYQNETTPDGYHVNESGAWR